MIVPYHDTKTPQPSIIYCSNCFFSSYSCYQNYIAEIHRYIGLVIWWLVQFNIYSQTLNTRYSFVVFIVISFVLINPKSHNCLGYKREETKNTRKTDRRPNYLADSNEITYQVLSLVSPVLFFHSKNIVH